MPARRGHPPIREAIELLQVERIDYGATCMSDPALVRDLAARQIPFTVCPLPPFISQATGVPQTRNAHCEFFRP